MEASAITLLTTYLAASVRMAVPLTLAGLGEAVSEKSGVINIGLEAIMLLGAFCSFIVTFYTKNLILGLAAGALGGAAVSMLHAVLSIYCRVNQTISGLALNFTVSGLTSFLFLIVFGQSTELPVCNVFNNKNIFVYIALACVAAAAIVFYRSEWGVRLHAVGEHPRAADTAGISVSAIRYGACLVNGLLGGLAGSYITLSQLGFFMENITAGKGYIALAVVILGRRNPVGIFLAAMVIGFSEALQFNLQTLGFSAPSQVFTMFPYLMAVAVLCLSIGKSGDPAALGIPYERDKR